MLIFYSTIILCFVRCTNGASTKNLSSNNGKGIVSDSLNQILNDEQVVMSILYQQNAAEYRALCLQAYNIARIKLNDELKNKNPRKPLAVITDLDETALDNSNFYGWLYNNKTTFDIKVTNWPDWCAK